MATPSKKRSWNLINHCSSAVKTRQEAPLTPRRRVQPRLETLEERITPTATLYVDFGFNFPAGGLTVTNAQMGPVNGPSVFPGGHTIIPLLTTVQNQNLDLNGDAASDLVDAYLLASQVIGAMQRTYAPFDVNIQLANAATIGDIATTLASTATNDAYMIVAGDSDPAESAFGWAQLDTGNTQDNLGFAFANQLITSLGTGSMVTALGRTASHEAGHTFGLDHTDAASSANGILGVGDVMGTTAGTAQPGDTDQRDFSLLHLFSRFPLALVDDRANTQNNYALLAANVGLASNAPAYVTGTGGFDHITITKAGIDTAHVLVQAYSNAGMTTLLSTFDYTVDTTNGIVVETGDSADLVEIDAKIATNVTVRGGNGNDRLLVDGFNAGGGSYTPGNATNTGLDGRTGLTGTLWVGSMSINLSEFRAAGAITVQNVASFTVYAPGGNFADNITIGNGPAAGQTQIQGTVNGTTAMVPLIFQNITSVNLDVGNGDGANPDDTVTIANQLAATGLQNMALLTGNGNDTVILQATNLTLPVSGGSFVFDGGIGSDTLVGPNTDGVTWTLDGADHGSVDDPLLFTHVENLVGGSGTDTLNIALGGSLSGYYDAGDGDDTLSDNTGTANQFDITGPDEGYTDSIAQFVHVENLTGDSSTDVFRFHAGAVLTGNVNGFSGSADALDFSPFDLGVTINLVTSTVSAGLGGTFANINRIIGSGRVDTLVGGNDSNTWTVTNLGTGDVDGFLFAAIESLTGGSAGDTFKFVGSGRLTGGIDGGTGANTVIGNDTGNAFLINGPDKGTIAGLLGTAGFVNIGSLQGGLYSDTFTFFDAGSGFPAGKLSGTIKGGGAGSVGDTLVGNDNGDTFTINGANAGTLSDAANGTLLTGGFTAIQNLTGGLADDTFTFAAGGSLTGQVDGGGQGPVGDTLAGDSTGRTFTVTGANAGTVSVLLPAGFVHVENLTGGSADDTFKFLVGGSLSGAIAGGGGTNTLVGSDAGHRFLINGGVNPDAAVANAGTVVGLLGTGGFTSIQNLTGGLWDDTFVFVDGGKLTGRIDGGSRGPGGNTVVGNENGDFFNVTGTDAGTVSDSSGVLVTGGFVHIQNLTGGALDDLFTFIAPGKLTGRIDGGGQSADGNTIVGDDNGDAFTIKGTDAGSIAGILAAGFGNVQNLAGGSNNDTFQFVAAGLLTGIIDGGLGTNTIVGNNAGDHFILNGGEPGVEVLSAAGAGYIVTLLYNGFLNIQNLTGGFGADTFSFQPGGSLDGNIDGGLGRDTLDYAQFNLLVTTNLQTGKSTAITGTGTFAAIEIFVGGPADASNLVGGLVPGTLDTLIGLNSKEVWAITGPNAGTINLTPTGTVVGGVFYTFSAYENLTGGTDRDVFRFSSTGQVDGKIDGQAGLDWLDYTLIPSGVIVNLTTHKASRTGIIGAIENAIGSATGGDIMVGDALNNIFIAHGSRNTLYGMAGRDLLVSGEGGNGLLHGGLGDDLQISGSTAFDANLDALDAIMKEWSRATSFASRVTNVLTGGGLTAGNKLQMGTTVILSPLPPAARNARGGGLHANTVVGSLGQDLFFVRWGSLITDFNRFLDRVIKPV